MHISLGLSLTQLCCISHDTSIIKSVSSCHLGVLYNYYYLIQYIASKALPSPPHHVSVDIFVSIVAVVILCLVITSSHLICFLYIHKLYAH